MRGQRKRNGTGKRSARFTSEDWRVAISLSHRAGGDNAVACARAIGQPDHHLYRARVEAARRNFRLAKDHRHTAERLDRVLELLIDWGGMKRRRGGRDPGDLLPSLKGARLRTGRPLQGH